MEEAQRTDDTLSVRKRLTDVLDDLDLICRQIAELVTVPRERRSFGASLDWQTLADLFTVKTTELETIWDIAIQQTERQKLIDCIQHEVVLRNEYVERLRNCLLESETILVNAIYKANLKLKAIREAELRPVSPDNLVRYAHRISSANSVSAPPYWQIGDPERPFPTDVEMRSGWLSRISGGADFSGATAAAPSSVFAHPSPALMAHAASGGAADSSVTVATQSDAGGKLTPSAASCWTSSPRSAPSSKPRIGAAAVSSSSSPTVTAGRTPLRGTQPSSVQSGSNIRRELSTSVDTTEALSSDSSSSSSSDSPS